MIFYLKTAICCAICSGGDGSWNEHRARASLTDRASLTEFLRRPWIHNSALEEPAVVGTSSAVRKLQRAFRRLRERAFNARLKQHMGALVASTAESGALVHASSVVVAVAALGMCDKPSAAAYVAAVLCSPPLDGRATLRAILQQVYRRAGPAAASTTGAAAGAANRLDSRHGSVR